MIEITKSRNADSRSKDGNFSIETLRADTESHVHDVNEGIKFFCDELIKRGKEHDHTKFEYMEDFYKALTSGQIKSSDWYKRHITEERHHLSSFVHPDVNMVDLMECIIDCVMAGMARSGKVYDVTFPNELLQLAVKNTVKWLMDNTHVSQSDDIMDQTI